MEEWAQQALLPFLQLMARLQFSLIFLLKSLMSIGQTEVLIWSDEFDGVGVPNPEYWSYDMGNNGWGNNEIQNYTSSLSNARQQNGVLILEAVKENGLWTSARILTRNKFNFTYGRIVFRAKLPSGAGTWPALWMLGENISSIGWPACGEIDVMEHVGKNPGVIQSALHTPASFGNTQNKGSKVTAPYDSEFHTYEADWSSEKIDFKLDGETHYSFSPPIKNENTWPFSKSFFIIMNIAMGGNFGSDPTYESGGLKNGIDPLLTNARMEIDYVRVFQKEIVTGNLDNENRGFKISPNPVNHLATITTTQPGKTKLQIQNLLGLDLMSINLIEENTVVDLSDMTDGLYLFSIVVDDLRYTEKILLQRKL